LLGWWFWISLFFFFLKIVRGGWNFVGLLCSTRIALLLCCGLALLWWLLGSLHLELSSAHDKNIEGLLHIHSFHPSGILHVVGMSLHPSAPLVIDGASTKTLGRGLRIVVVTKEGNNGR
jgi:hypothetical protein